MGKKTLVDVDSKKTIRERLKNTLFEDRKNTTLENDNASGQNNLLTKIDEYIVKKRIKTTGGEADIYLVEKKGKEYIAKVYRFGISPKEEILKKVKEISEKFPKDIIKIEKFGYSQELGQWFEILEYAIFGSLEDFALNREFDSVDINKIIEEINDGLYTLHTNEILHLDLKPSNVLVRSEKPIDLVFGDFGISTELRNGMSKKMTGVKGTPLYWAPESFTGVVGRECDYWSLGVIILELLSKEHPFEGIDTKVITYTISTRGVDVPKDIQDEYKLLLMGLLTRNPKKRWGYNEVKKWLKGDRNIPVFYDGGIKGGYGKSYKFDNRDFYDIESLVFAFSASDKNWEEAKIHILRGYITKWLELNEDFNAAVKFDKLREEDEVFSDITLVKIIYTYNPKADFTYRGKLITVNNIYGYFLRHLKKEADEAEEKISIILKSGDFGEVCSAYLDKSISKNSDVRVIKTISEKLIKENDETKKIECFSSIFKALSNKENYIKFDNMVDFSQFVVENYEYLVTGEEFDKAVQTYVLPKSVKSFEKYTEEEFTAFCKLIKQGKKINKEEFLKLQTEYVIPDSVKNIEEVDIKEYEMIVDICEKTKFITKDELRKNIEKYFIPTGLVKGFEEEEELFWILFRFITENGDALLENKSIDKISENIEFKKEKNILNGKKWQNSDDLLKDYLNFVSVCADVFKKEGKFIHAAENYSKLYEKKRYTDEEIKNIFGSIAVDIVYEIENCSNVTEIENVLKIIKNLNTGSLDGVENLIFNVGNNFYNNRKILEAIVCFSNVTGKKKSDAELKLGMIYLNEEDFEKAYGCFTKSASTGNVEAVYMKGFMIEKGQVPIKDKDVAKKYYKLASDKGHKKAIEDYKRFGMPVSVFGMFVEENYKNESTVLLSDERFFAMVSRGKINSVRFYKNGKLCAIGESGKDLRVIETISGRVMVTFKGSDMEIKCVEYSKDGEMIAGASDDGRVLVWNVKNGELLAELNCDKRGVLCVAFSDDGKKLAAAGFSKEISIWNVSDFSLIKVIENNFINPMIITGSGAYNQGKEFINSICFSEDGNQIASCGNGRLARISDVKTGQVVIALDTSEFGNSEIQYSPDKRYVAVSGYDGKIRIWNAKEGRFVKSIQVNQTGVNDFTYTKDGRFIVSCGKEGIKLWRVKEGILAGSISNNQESVVVDISFDNSKLISGNADGTVKLWDIDIIDFGA